MQQAKVGGLDFMTYLLEAKARTRRVDQWQMFRVSKADIRAHYSLAGTTHAMPLSLMSLQRIMGRLVECLTFMPGTLWQKVPG